LNRREKNVPLIAILLLASTIFAQDQREARPRRPGVLTQFSTLDALMLGIYEGSFTVAQVREQGDFGVGTYEGLDGEMIILDGRFYQMRTNGVLSEATDTDRVPFAVVTHFKPDLQLSVNQATYARLTELIDAALPSKNLFYAIRVRGPFVSITARSVSKQYLPYPPLPQVVATQTLFNSSNIAGTLVGIRSPAFAAGVNQVGHHFHFVSDDRKTGGHAVDFTTGAVTVEVQILRRHSVWLPDNVSFENAGLPIQ